MSAIIKQQEHHLDIAQITGSTEAINNQLIHLETVAEMQARELCDWFKAEREKIRQAMGTAATKQEFSERFSPLWLASRMHKGTLEITWNVQKARSKPDANGKTHPIFGTKPTKGKGHGYSLTKLAPLARGYELELVIEAERRATVLRDFWSRIVALRGSLRSINRQVEEVTSMAGLESSRVEISQVSAVAGVQAANDQSKSDELIAAAAEFPQSGLVHHQRAGYE